jgi:hypothetical protein
VRSHDSHRRDNRQLVACLLLCKYYKQSINGTIMICFSLSDGEPNSITRTSCTTCCTTSWQLVRRWQSTDGQVVQQVRRWTTTNGQVANLLYNKLYNLSVGGRDQTRTSCATSPLVDRHLRTSCTTCPLVAVPVRPGCFVFPANLWKLHK